MFAHKIQADIFMEGSIGVVGKPFYFAGTFEGILIENSGCGIFSLKARFFVFCDTMTSSKMTIRRND